MKKHLVEPARCEQCHRVAWEASECRVQKCPFHCLVTIPEKDWPMPEKKETANDRQVGGEHYRSAQQHWDFISENNIGYLEAQVLKYAARWAKKNGVQDVQKAIHFCDKITELASAQYRPGHHVSTPRVLVFATANSLTELETNIYLGVCQWNCVQDLRMVSLDLKSLLERAEKTVP